MAKANIRLVYFHGTTADKNCDTFHVYVEAEHPFWFVDGESGRMYHHSKGPFSRGVAERLRDKVKAARVIDLEHWTAVEVGCEREYDDTDDGGLEPEDCGYWDYEDEEVA